MATPHVSGAAAVLKELHPDWTPGDIKAALMQSAQDIGVDIWKQGKGRIDVFKAAQVKVAVSPGTIAFGNVSDTLALWTAAQSVKLHNLSGDSIIYFLSISGDLPDGISFTFPQYVLLTDSVNFNLAMSVNTQKVKFPNTIPSFLKGNLILKSHFDTIQIPFVVNKTNTLKLIFDRVPDLVIIHNNANIKNFCNPSDSVFYYAADQEGYYDIITSWDGFMTNVVKEQVYLKNNTTLNISSTEAVNEITLKSVDQNGKQLPILSGASETLCTKDNKNGLMLMIIQFYQEQFTSTEVKRKISNLSDRYAYDITTISCPSWNESHKYYTVPFEFADGISTSRTVSNSASDFVKVIRRFPSSIKNKNIYFTSSSLASGISGILDFYQKPYYNLDPGNTLTSYHIPLPSSNYLLTHVTQTFKSEIIDI
jgi:hypothetical protein